MCAPRQRTLARETGDVSQPAETPQAEHELQVLRHGHVAEAAEGLEDGPTDEQRLVAVRQPTVLPASPADGLERRHGRVGRVGAVLERPADDRRVGRRVEEMIHVSLR